METRSWKIAAISGALILVSGLLISIVGLSAEPAWSLGLDRGQLFLILGLGLTVGSVPAALVGRRASGPVRGVILAAVLVTIASALYVGFQIPLRQPARPPGPVVLVIFDELPTATLMTAGGDLDAVSFPNFARLGARATWYRRATAAYHDTRRAVPAILSGLQPEGKTRPTLADHGLNLFLLVEPDLPCLSYEYVTHLNPPSFQADLASRPDVSWWQAAVAMGRHTLGITAAQDSLVSLDELGTRNAEARSDHYSGPGSLRNLLAGLDEQDGPSLHVLHSVYPHARFKHYPDGSTYVDPRRDPLQAGSQWGGWPDDPQIRLQSWQRHLLQSQWADTVLGQILDKLESLPQSDAITLVVTADHGASFSAGQPRRELTSANASEIAAVPLLVMEPGQLQGRVVDHPVSTLDVLPTLARVMNVTVPWRLAGADLAAAGDGREPVCLGKSGLREGTPSLDAVVAVARRRDDRFGPPVAGGRFLMVPGISLQGKPVREVDTELGVVPGSGKPGGLLFGWYEDPGGDVTAVVAVHRGEVVAAAAPLRLRGGGRRFWTLLLPPDVVRAGGEAWSLRLIQENDSGPEVLVPIRRDGVPRTDRLEFGGRPFPWIEESGFQAPVWKSGSWRRWTKGHGQLAIPLARGDEPDSLALELLQAAPGGAPLQIVGNGQLLLDLEIPRDGWRGTIGLEGLGLTDTLTLEIVSPVFVPAELSSNSGDRRSLGVLVQGLQLF